MTGSMAYMVTSWVAVFVLLILPSVNGNVTIKATLTNNAQPAISSLDGNSLFKYNYNAAYIPVYQQGKLMDGLLVRVQNLVNNTDPYSVGPSKIAISIRQGTLLPQMRGKLFTIIHPLCFLEFWLLVGSFAPNNFQYSTITQSNVIIQPEDASDSQGTEDPRLAYNEKTKTYYLMYTAVAKNDEGGVNAYLSLATCDTDPTQASEYVNISDLLNYLCSY